MSGANDNCLRGISCPQCGREEAFLIEGADRTGVRTLEVRDDGCDSFGDFVFDDTANCSCAACPWKGTVGQATSRPEKRVPAETITFRPEKERVELTKRNGNTFLVASYDNASRSHRRGAFVCGDCPGFSCSKRTKAKILAHFYPGDSLAYLEEHGYIAY